MIKRVKKIWCRVVGHKFELENVDRTGFRCPRCKRYIRGDIWSREAVAKWRATHLEAAE